jgi:predicted Zn-dependent protease
VCSIRSLLEKNGLLQIREANQQVKDAPEDAERAFSLLLEWIESYERDDDVLAFRKLREFVSLRPDSVQGRLFLAYSACNIYEMNTFRKEYKTLADENFREAFQAAQKSIDLFPDQYYWLWLAQARALIGLGKIEEAGNFYRRILLQEPERYSFWYHYCKFLIENQPQNKSEAAWALDRAESLYKPEEGPRYKDLCELREKLDQIRKQDKK